MDRRERTLEHIRPGMRGIEIGAYFCPLVPKAAGWDVVVLDVFPAETLRRKALASAEIEDAWVAQIEEVDLLGPAHRLAELAEAAGHAPGSFDFIVSSHNFEHLPDPVRFLQAAERMLKPGGVLSLLIPDKRYCFDLLRPRSTLGAVLEAWFARREQPTPRQVFEHWADKAVVTPRGGPPVGQREGEPLDGVTLPQDLAQRFADWRAAEAAGSLPYEDAHCWTFTPASAELMLRDLRFLGLTGLEVLSCGPTVGIEFVLHLRRPDAAQPVVPAEHQAERRRLSRALLLEDGAVANQDDVQARLDAVLASTSWRMTAPLRGIMHRIRGRGA